MTFIFSAAEPHHSSIQAPKQLPDEDAYRFDYKESAGKLKNSLSNLNQVLVNAKLYSRIQSKGRMLLRI